MIPPIKKILKIQIKSPPKNKFFGREKSLYGLIGKVRQSDKRMIYSLIEINEGEIF